LKSQKEFSWYIPVSSAADILDCHWRKIYELIQQGELESIQMPWKTIKISEDSIERYLMTPQ
jgi:excisionase family DNA binding protein